MIKRWGVLFVLICLLVSGTAWAEFFRYRDANGVLRFTDNLAEVPVNQRPKVKQYEEATDSMTSEQKAAKAEEDARAEREKQKNRQPTLSSGGNDTPVDVNDPGFVEYLNRTKRALDDEYAGFMKEKSELEATKATLKTKQDVKQYEKQVIDLNNRIKDYSSRLGDFKVKADAFNMGAKPK